LRGDSFFSDDDRETRMSFGGDGERCCGLGLLCGLKVATRGDEALGDSHAVFVDFGSTFLESGISLAWKNLFFGSSWTGRVVACCGGYINFESSSSIPLPLTRLGGLRCKFERWEVPCDDTEDLASLA